MNAERIALRHAEADDLQDAAALLSAGLGLGYVKAADLRKLTRTSGECFLAERDGELLGVGTVQIVHSISDVLPVSHQHVAAQLRAALRCAHAVGIMKSVAVTPAARRQGVGRQLVKVRLAWLRERKIENALSFVVTSKEGKALGAGLLVEAGFSLITMLPNFWTAGSEAGEYSCPTCGVPCHCSAAVYRWFIEPPAPPPLPKRLLFSFRSPRTSSG